MGNNLTNQYIDESFHQLVQISGSQLTDGTGSLIPELDVTASFALDADHATTADTATSATTAAFASAAATASFALTASYAEGFDVPTLQQVTDAGNTTFNTISSPEFIGSLTGTATNATISLYADTANSASYALSSSYAENGGVTQIVAGSNITLLPPDGKGVVTVSAAGAGIPADNGIQFQVLRTDGANGYSWDWADRAQIEIRTLEAVAKGDPLYVAGFNVGQNRVEVRKADASDPAKMPAYGLAYETVAGNTNSQMVAIGSLQNINTQTPAPGYNTGDTLYVKAGGGLTKTKPQGTNLVQNVGIVGRGQQNNGEILVSAIGRSNDIPNLPDGFTWVGDINGVASAVSTGSLSVASAVSSSYAVNAGSANTANSATTAISASHAVNADSAANAISASYAETASFALNSVDTTYDLDSIQTGANVALTLVGSDASLDTVTLVAGSNITLTDDGSNNVTIDAAGVASSLLASNNTWTGTNSFNNDFQVSNTSFSTVTTPNFTINTDGVQQTNNSFGVTFQKPLSGSITTSFNNFGGNSQPALFLNGDNSYVQATGNMYFENNPGGVGSGSLNFQSNGNINYTSNNNSIFFNTPGVGQRSEFTGILRAYGDYFRANVNRQSNFNQFVMKDSTGPDDFSFVNSFGFGLGSKYENSNFMEQYTDFSYANGAEQIFNISGSTRAVVIGYNFKETTLYNEGGQGVYRANVDKFVVNSPTIEATGSLEVLGNITNNTAAPTSNFTYKDQINVTGVTGADVNRFTVYNTGGDGFGAKYQGAYVFEQFDSSYSNGADMALSINGWGTTIGIGGSYKDITHLNVGGTAKFIADTDEIELNTTANVSIGSQLVLADWANLNFADDTAAAAGGVPLGGIYRSGNVLLIRIV